MAKKQTPEKTDVTSRADELISSYLVDMFGPVGSEPAASDFDSGVEQIDEIITLQEQSPLSPAELKAQLQLALESATMDRSRSLISTVDPVAAAKSKAMLSKPQSFLMLLISLYYLRRPLPDRVKQCFIDVSERMLDDYEASEWQAQIARPNGVYSEARS